MLSVGLQVDRPLTGSGVVVANKLRDLWATVCSIYH